MLRLVWCLRLLPNAGDLWLAVPRRFVHLTVLFHLSTFAESVSFSLPLHVNKFTGHLDPHDAENTWREIRIEEFKRKRKRNALPTQKLKKGAARLTRQHLLSGDLDDFVSATSAQTSDAVRVRQV